MAAFFMAPLPIILFMILSPAIGLGAIEGPQSAGDLIMRLSIFWLALLISVPLTTWYARSTGRDGYLPYAFGAVLAVTMIGGYFSYKGAEYLQSEYPLRYQSGAIRIALLRALAVSAIYGAVIGVCFRAIAGRTIRKRSDIDHLRERFE